MAHSADSFTLKLPSSLFPLGPGLLRDRRRPWASLLFSDIGAPASPQAWLCAHLPAYTIPLPLWFLSQAGSGKWSLLPLIREVWESGL